MLYSDKGGMFRRARPHCAGKTPNGRPPPRHTPLQLVSSFCCFPTTVYMQPDSLSIFWERHSRPLRTLPLCCVYQLGLCLSTTLPPFALLHRERVPGTITWYAPYHRLWCMLFTVPTVPFCCLSSSSKIKWFHKPVRDFAVLYSSHRSSSLSFLCLSHVNKTSVCHNRRW